MASHAVTLLFEDGRAVRIAAREEETLYAAGVRSDVRLVTDCREGACATCEARCTRGSYWLGDYSSDALSREAADDRRVLACQMHVTSECVVEFPYASSLALDSPEVDERWGTVREVEFVSSCVARLSIRADDGMPIWFLPGQYAHLDVPGSTQTRAFSFANLPGTAASEFFIRLLPSGLMSDYLRERAAPGDRLRIRGPFGRLYMRPLRGPLLMVAGGTGLAPFLSMLEALSADPDDLPAITLLYGANHEHEFFALDRLEALVARGMRLTYVRSVVHAGTGWTGPSGHVTDLLDPTLAATAFHDVYLCGPPMMIDAAKDIIVATEGRQPAIYSELFLPSASG